jgi:uncharacterized protein HemY
MERNRLHKLETLLAKTPGDAFLLYALGLEHRKQGNWDQAVAYLRQALAADGSYVAAWLMMGQIHQQSGDLAAARQTYTQGIAAARHHGNQHAAAEMEAALAALG